MKKTLTQKLREANANIRLLEKFVGKNNNEIRALSDTVMLQANQVNASRATCSVLDRQLADARQSSEAQRARNQWMDGMFGLVTRERDEARKALAEVIAGHAMASLMLESARQQLINWAAMAAREKARGLGRSKSRAESDPLYDRFRCAALIAGNLEPKAPDSLTANERVCWTWFIEEFKTGESYAARADATPLKG